MRYPVGRPGNTLDTLWYDAQGFGVKTTYGYHEGNDFNLRTGGNTDLGQPLYAVADGKIVYFHNASHPTTGFGRHMVLECQTSRGTRWYHYAHCLEMTSEVKTVKEGDVIGKLGASGTTYAHLHFAVFKVNPSGLYKGIDSIARTLSELNASWEKFEILTMPENTELDKCRVARDSWWNNQTKLTATVGVTGLTDANANDKVNEAVTKINQLKKDLDGATNQVKAKETEISRLTASLDGEKSANQALRSELQTFMEVLAGKLTTTVDKPNIIGAVEKLLTVEDDLLKARKDLESSERARKELEADKDRQIQGLKDEINQLRKANDELENRVDKQAEQIERLGKRLEELGSTPVDPTPGLISRLKTLVTDFLDTWRKA